MHKHIQCPSCGGKQAVHNPGISMVVCEYCSTTLYWNADAIIHTGEKSLLPDDDTRLFHAATGKLDGKPFKVIGHVRYAYASTGSAQDSGGHWDEWYVEFDGKTIWLSEDERELFWETPLAHPDNVPAAHFVLAGQKLNLDGKKFTVLERGTAICVGGWGQLPFTVLPGEQYPYADLATQDGQSFATLEYDKNGTVHGFIGKALPHEQLQVDERQGAAQAEFDAKTQADGIQCASCAAPLSLPSERKIQTLVCDYCGAQNALSGAEAVLMGQNRPKDKPQFAFEIGQKGKFRGAAYEVCGRQLHEDDEGYEALTYLLWNAQRGYVYLETTESGYSLTEATLEAPDADPFALDEGDNVRVGNRQRFSFIEDGEQTVRYVDGAFPWRVARGDKSRYADFASANKVYSVEINASGTEIEYFIGDKLSQRAVLRAFGMTVPQPQEKPSPVAESKQFEGLRVWQAAHPFGSSVLLIFLVLASFISMTLAFLDNSPTGFFLHTTFFAVPLFTALALLSSTRRNSLSSGMLFLLALFGSLIAPLTIIFSIVALIVLHRRLFFPQIYLFIFPVLIAVVLVPEHLKHYSEQHLKTAKTVLDNDAKALTIIDNLSENLPDLKTRQAWIAKVKPASQHWLAEVQMLEQKRLAMTTQIADLQARMNQANLWNAHTLPAYSQPLLVQQGDMLARLEALQQDWQALLTYQRELPKMLAQYQDYYQQIQPDMQDAIERRMVQAELDFPFTPVKNTLAQAWQGATPPPAALLEQANALWQTTHSTYQQALRGEITPAVYETFPAVRDQMYNIVRPIEEKFNKTNDLLQQLYTYWEKLLVDMEVVDGYEVKFYQDFRTVKVDTSGATATYQVQDQRTEVTRDTYNQFEPFMGMNVAHKPLGYFDNQAVNAVLPAGYAMLPNTFTRNAFGDWQTPTEWQWAAGLVGVSAVLWGTHYAPQLEQVKAAQSAAQNRQVYVSDAGQAAVFGNQGSFTRTMYADSYYYRNQQYRNTRYISSGRTWLGTKYDNDGYRSSGSSSGGSRAGGGK